MGLEESWRRASGSLEASWRKIGGGLKEDGCRCIVFGLVTPQDGLVTPTYGNYVRTSLKNVSNFRKMKVFHDFSIRALKLAANHEKQVFTFFAFLPPYMGVSGSAVPRKR